METGIAQATPEEMRWNRIRCWTPQCGKRAYFEDWAGWHWCLKHWYSSLRGGGFQRWFYFKTTKLRWF